MRTNAYGYACLQDAYVNNLYPVVKNALWQDAYTFVLEIDSSKLNFGTEYGILLKKTRSNPCIIILWQKILSTK